MSLKNKKICVCREQFARMRTATGIVEITMLHSYKCMKSFFVILTVSKQRKMSKMKLGLDLIFLSMKSHSADHYGHLKDMDQSPVSNDSNLIKMNTLTDVRHFECV